ncbi:MAG: hypothetical protein V7647_328 [Acidobacteriota bacterium]
MHGLDGDAAHAPVRERTFAQHAGAAPDVLGEHDLASSSERICLALVGRSEYRGDIYSERGGEVHRARVVRHEPATIHQDSAKRRQISPRDRIDDSRRGIERREDLRAGSGITPAADQHRRHVVAEKIARERRK